MKRVLLTILTLLAFTGCSQERSFEKEGGVCYRRQTDKVLGLPINRNEVQSLDENCEGQTHP